MFCISHVHQSIIGQERYTNEMFGRFQIATKFEFYSPPVFISHGVKDLFTLKRNNAAAMLYLMKNIFLLPRINYYMRDIYACCKLPGTKNIVNCLIQTIYP